MDAAQRIGRERDFHNQRFEDDSAREDRVRKFYDAIGYGFELYRQRVREESPNRVVLEYGCGTESLAFEVAPTARQVTGIDISDVAIRQAQSVLGQRDLHNVKFVVDNAEDMHVADASIDVVTGSGIIHHLDIQRAMRELRRVLREGGIAIFAEPMGHNPVLNWYRNRTPELRTPDEHPLLMSDLRTMSHEFRSMKVTYFGLVAPLLAFLTQNPAQRTWLTRGMWWLDRMLCRIPLVHRYAWFCCVELRA